ncbi:Helicase domain protein [Candidatus Protofrankia californiensis]|uniref:Helicase domain protein n=1 Tax=Candidatus Protofrankia californiensis TaxID=1839754 RepID=A0A1C3PBB0_9ACTN|nr:Helicase domain protein [Candidatus Protofrankia californiensis]
MPSPSVPPLSRPTRCPPPTSRTPTTTPTCRNSPGSSPTCGGWPKLADGAPERLTAALAPLVDGYRAWIARREAAVDDPASHLGPYRLDAADALGKARDAADRISAGISRLATDPVARAAFGFANRAMHLQRVHTKAAAGRHNAADRLLDDVLSEVDVPANRSWRPFQLAFILLCLPALADPDHPERSDDRRSAVADLLWFPTGGGKTKVYLGLTAFTLAVCRLAPASGGLDPTAGVAVLMRYTLRLLTIQQFQRATALICACETLRQAGPSRRGATPFRIGLWVGGRVTPNRTDGAEVWLSERRRGTGLRAGGGGSSHQLTS